MAQLGDVVKSRQLAIFLGIVVFPGILLAISAAWLLKSASTERDHQRLVREQQIMRLLEDDIDEALLEPSLKSLEAPLRFRLEDGRLWIDEFSLEMTSTTRGITSHLDLSAQEERSWESIQSVEKRVTPEALESQYRELLKNNNLAPSARLALLRVSIQTQDAPRALLKLSEIHSTDRSNRTHYGIPVWVGAALLLTASNAKFLGANGQGASQISLFLTDTLQGLSSGFWKLTGYQWIVYVQQILEADRGHLMSEQQSDLQKALTRVVFLSKRAELLADLCQQRKADAPDPKVFAPQSKLIAAVLPGQNCSGVVFEAEALLNLATALLTQLTTAEDFAGHFNLGEGADNNTGTYPLVSLPEATVSFQEKQPRGLVSHLSLHGLLYAVSLLFVISILGLSLTYRSVAKEMSLAQLKSDFVASVTHEFRSPIANVQALLERIETGKASDPQMISRYYRIIKQELSRLNVLVSELLDFSQFRKGRKQLTLEESDLAVIVEEAMTSFPWFGSTKRVHLRNEYRGKSIQVKLNVLSVTQCIHNLIENALKYSSEDSRVDVAVGVDGQEAFIEVADQGIGISGPEKEKIFQPFYRAPQTATVNVKGVGLGLALVKQSMTSLGGRVTVESAMGHGSCFRLLFPLGEK
jgi:signal transduction histidine kinase